MFRARATFAAALLLAAAVGCAPDGQACISLGVASVESPERLADASDYLVRATLTSAPQKSRSHDDFINYWVSDATITEVVAQRPDVPVELAAGATVPIGTSLLNSASRLNCDDQADIYPDETDMPAAGDTIVAFLTHTELGEQVQGFAAMGQGVVGTDGKVRMRAIPGPLNHQVVDVSAVTTDLAGRFAGPRT